MNERIKLCVVKKKFMNFIKEPHIYICACINCMHVLVVQKMQQKREITIFVLIFKNFSVESFNSMFT